MTWSGSAHGRFRRALDNDDLLAARAAAIELKHVGLTEALELTVLILAKEQTRFRAAALRWHGRYCGRSNRKGLLRREADARIRTADPFITSEVLGTTVRSWLCSTLVEQGKEKLAFCRDLSQVFI